MHRDSLDRAVLRFELLKVRKVSCQLHLSHKVGRVAKRRGPLV